MDKFKILLLYLNNEIVFEELGVAYIASYMQDKGYSVKEMVYCKKDDELDECIKEIIDYKPDIIGINVYNHNKLEVFDICRILKKQIPDIYICAGGAEASSQKETLLYDEKTIDFSIVGEGEKAFYDLVKRLEASESITDVAGLIYRESGNIKINNRLKITDNLDDIPNPSRFVLSSRNLKVASVLTSRGCNGNCSFCMTPHMWNVGGVKWRGRTETLAIDEVESIRKEYNISNFYFFDCSFEDPNILRMEKLADELIKRNLNIFYTVDIRASLYKKCNDNLIYKLQKSGLFSVFLGLEAGNQNDLKLYNKGVTVADNLNSLQYFNEHGIITHFGFINFNPYSTFERLYENSQFLNKSMDYTLTNLMGYSSYLKAYKGIALYEKIRNDRLLKEGIDGIFDYNFTDKRVEALAVYCYLHMPEIIDKYKVVFHDFADMYLRGLKLLERHIRMGNADEKLLPLITETQDFTRNELKTFFIENNSFDLLLDLAVQGWSNAKADNILADTFSDIKMAALIKKLIGQKNKLFRYLIKHDDKIINLIS